MSEKLKPDGSRQAAPRMTPHTQTVLRVLMGYGSDLGDRHTVRTEGLYGLELTRRTGLPNGTLFPVLERLTQCGWVERYWEQDGPAEREKRPRRRYYRITTNGADPVGAALAEVDNAKPVRAGRVLGAFPPGLAGER